MRRIDPWLAFGLILLFVLLVAALFGERLAPHEPIEVVLNIDREPPPFAPGPRFPLGSDLLGRDLLSLMLAGARATLGIAATAGVARVVLAMALAMFASVSRPVRELLDGLADLFSSIPATLVAVLAVLVFAGTDTLALTFIAALLLTGWAGPYRVLSSELRRLARAPFTESALSIGIRRRALIFRHHLPHLLPLTFFTASQQVAAALVALAELGVLAVFVGRLYITANAVVSDPPEWGGLLARGRTVEALYTTRWVFLVPGATIALAAMAFGMVGIGVSRQFRRRNLIDSLRSPFAAGGAVLVLTLVAVSAVVPPRYAEARTWATDARSALATVADDEAAMRASGMRPIGPGYAVENSFTAPRQTGAATVELRDGAETIALREGADPASDLQTVLYSGSGGATVDAPLVFAGWGVSPDDFALQSTSPFGFGLDRALVDWADDYAAVDVRGKVAVILRLPALRAGNSLLAGPDLATTVTNATRRGARAVLYVDPQKGTYAQIVRAGGFAIDPYRRLADNDPPERTEGTPVFVLSVAAADRLLASSGVKPSEIYAAMVARTGRLLYESDETMRQTSLASALPFSAHIVLPVERVTLASRSLLGEHAPTAGTARVLVWAVDPDPGDADRASADVLASLARLVNERALGDVVVVLFDPSGDPRANAKLVRDRLGDRTVSLVLVVQALRGDHIEVLTASPDLVLAADSYTETVADAVAPRSAASDAQWTWPGVSSFADARALWIRGTGEPAGDLRADAAAYAAYVLGRWALGAPELRR
ncbi:MAG TPA: ABC transporter permease subunit [Candidatus Limnocylindria bacterium]